MKTRSQTTLEKQGIYGDFVFDFDESTREWNANKKKLDNGCYEYVCGNISDKTKKKCMNKTICGSNCRYHQKQ
jgi:fibrillarin-like rRNA methylase